VVIGNKDLSVILADGVCQVRVHIRIRSVFIGEHTRIWNMNGADKTYTA